MFLLSAIPFVTISVCLSWNQCVYTRVIFEHYLGFILLTVVKSVSLMKHLGSKDS